MERIALHIGRALREAREQRGLTLRAAAQLSGDRYRPSSIASWERGERAISLVRFCELAELYGIAPEQLLRHALRPTGARPVVIDLEGIDVDEPGGRLVLGAVRELLRQRSEPGSETIRIRTSDLEILATTAGETPQELLGRIQVAVRGGRRNREAAPTGDGERVTRP